MIDWLWIILHADRQKTLGWSVLCYSDCFMLINQHALIDILLTDKISSNSKHTSLPMDAKCHLPTENDEIFMDFQLYYQIVVRHISYRTSCIRPEHSFASCVLGATIHERSVWQKASLVWFALAKKMSDIYYSLKYCSMYQWCSLRLYSEF